MSEQPTECRSGDPDERVRIYREAYGIPPGEAFALVSRGWCRRPYTCTNPDHFDRID